MCDIAEGLNAVHRHEKRRANKEHTCNGCKETIRKGDTYAITACLFDGYWDMWKHCLRCDAMFRAIGNEAYAREGMAVAIEPGLDCGETWESAFRGEAPPEHVAALAFWLPGEPLPMETAGG